MTASRTQHLLASGVILAVSAWVCWISISGEPAEAFLLPRLISIFFVFFAVWNFVRAVMGLSKVGEGLSGTVIRAIVPGLIVMLIYFFWAAKGYGRVAALEGTDWYEWVRRGLGFYTSSTIAFFLIYTIYDPESLMSLKAWAKRIVVTVVFMSVIFGLFSELLQVQTPRGLYDGDTIAIYQTILYPLKAVITFLANLVSG